jgi:hypothetical protein
MMLTNPIKDFLIKASPHAKQCKVKELNYIEAELIMMEEEIMNLNAKGILPGDMGPFMRKIQELKNLVRNKRNNTAAKPVFIPGKMINARPARTA